MDIELNEAPIASVADLAQVPISFTVDRVCDVLPSADGSGGFVLAERPIETPYMKDYDATPGEGPLQFARRFDISNWGLILGRSKARLIAGAVVAFNTKGIAMLEGRSDLAVLWDIRVLPDARGKKIGSGLLQAAEAWAMSKGCRRLKVETQNINVPACKFYEGHGFVLRSVDRLAYPELPGEVQLLWYKDLSMPALRRSSGWHLATP